MGIIIVATGREEQPISTVPQHNLPKHTNLLSAVSIVPSTSYPFVIADGLKKRTGFYGALLLLLYIVITIGSFCMAVVMLRRDRIFL